MISPLDLLKRAENLAEENTEIEWRDSLKHAYYFVYHQANAVSKKYQLGLMLKNNGQHQFLINKIGSVESRTAKSLARDLEMLRARRTIACYDLAKNVTQIQAKQQLRDCKCAIEKLNKLEQELSES